MGSWWDSTESLTVCSFSALVEVGTVLPAQGPMVVARLDGAKMRDADLVFYKFTDAPLFPGYSAGTGTRCPTA
jgi:hypothetical protein